MMQSGRRREVVSRYDSTPYPRSSGYDHAPAFSPRLLAEDDARTSGKSGDGRDPYTDDDSVAFVRAVVAGESWAERELFERYAPMVHLTLRRCLGPLTDIDDLMQEVFLRVFDRLKTLRDLTALRSFVYTIAVRVARTDIRRLRLRRRSESSEFADFSAGEVVHSDPEAREALGRVEGVLTSLKATHRLAFVLRHLDGLAVCEVARQLHVSIPTVNRWLGLAVKHISKEIGDGRSLAGLVAKEGSA